MSTASQHRRLIIVSNRLPVSSEYREERLTFDPSPGGLATGLGSVYEEHKALWVGWPGSVRPQDQSEAARGLLKEHSSYPVWIPQDLVDRYYEGFANDTIWPLFHSMPSYARYAASGWEAYRDVNTLFCDALLQTVRKEDVLWIHDYHLMLLPKLVRERLPESKIGFFLHIPFPHYDMFRLLPWHREIAESLLASDLIGFHTYDYAQSFLDSVRRLMGYDNSVGRITMAQRVVQVDVFPMGIDVGKFSKAAESEPVRTEIEKISQRTGRQKLFFTVARLDYTKGLPQTLSAIERFYAKYPQWREKAVFLVVVVPSREGVADYAELKKQIDEKIGAVNSRIGTIGWTPIIYMYRVLSFEELVASYVRADVFMALSLRDGMNLTVKEYLASRGDGRGVPILSEMAGASRELLEALIVNPNNEEEIADSMHRALTLPDNEKGLRSMAMRNRLETHDIRFWTRQFLVRLDQVRSFSDELSVKLLTLHAREEIIRSYRDSSRRLILLDYDGTLVSFQDDPERVIPPTEVIDILRALAAGAANHVFLLSGRDRNFLQQWFGDLNLSLVGEHGAWYRADWEWKQTANLSDAWKASVRPIMDLFVDRIPGSFVEEKNFSLVWHYRRSDRQTAPQAAREMIDTLTHLTANLDIHVLPGNKVVEVKSTRVGKGEFYRAHLAHQRYDFILAVGDDWTDENLFVCLPPKAYSIRVGFNASAAKYNLHSPAEVILFLSGLTEKEGRT